LNKATLLLMMLAFSFSARSQSYDDSVATIEEAVADTTYEDEETETIEKSDHFLERSGEDSFFVSERHLPPDHAKKIKEDKDFWYANSELEKKEKKQQQAKTPDGTYVPLGQRTWFQTLLWFIIIAAFAGAIMWYLAESNVGLFRKKNLPAPGDSAMGEIPEDIFAINYQREIDKAAEQKNYRLAVRLMYLRLLKNLSDRNIIQYKQDKTNFDYLLQLQSTGYYNNFFRLTRHYEYSWYGHFDVEENAYQIINREFAQFEREIG
jgi:hypothetical protein